MKGGRLQPVCIGVGSRARVVDVGRGGWGEGVSFVRACGWGTLFTLGTVFTVKSLTHGIQCNSSRLSLRTFLRTLSPYALITAEGGK